MSIERLKALIRRTPIAGAARRVYRRWRPLTPDEQNDRYDAETLEVIARALPPDGHAVDVGAHSGSILRAIIQRAPASRHWAFEPLPAYAAILRRDFPQIDVEEVALAATSGRQTFQHVVTNPTYSGLRPRDYPQAERVEILIVETARLDDHLPPLVPIHFMKIDVEGGELGVLEGARATLARWRPVVVFEHGAGAASHYGTTPEAVFDVLARSGLGVTTMARWLAGQSGFNRAAFGTHYRKGRDFYYLAAPEGR
jgi:FkbM family methyltransferase